MDWARNSGSETPVKKLNPTSTTDFSYKTLCVTLYDDDNDNTGDVVHDVDDDDGDEDLVCLSRARS